LLPGLDDPSFRKEIGIMRRVNGLANVIYYHGYSNVINERSYVAILTEYCPKSLKDAIADPKNGSDPHLISKWMKYCYQIANGMHSLSVVGVLHRDLKAENCLLTHDDNIVICDFGLAVSSSSFRQMSKGAALATSQRGTVGYIAKEAFEGILSEYSDVFAYGILVVYLLFCECPWRDARGSNLRDEVIVDMIMRGKLPENVHRLTDEYFPELKPETLRTFAACCSEDPHNRPKFRQIMSVLRDPFKGVPSAPEDPRGDPHLGIQSGDDEMINELEGQLKKIKKITFVPQDIDGHKTAELKKAQEENAKAAEFTGVCERTLEGHSYSVRCLVQLADGRVVSGSDDSTLKVWK
jgi:hypothetical protein